MSVGRMELRNSEQRSRWTDVYDFSLVVEDLRHGKDLEKVKTLGGGRRLRDGRVFGMEDDLGKVKCGGGRLWTS